MKLIKAPDQPIRPMLFLAGSIMGAWDWQGYVAEQLANLKIIIFNPRRDDFDSLDPMMERQQISWEYRHLRMADAVLFWFSKETLAPITLFELGRHSTLSGKQLFVGIDKDYKRVRDVEIQMELARPDVPIFYSLPQLVQDVRVWTCCCK